MTLIWLQSHFVYDPRNVKLHVFSSPHAETSKEQTDNQKDHEALSVGLSLFLVVFLSFFFSVLFTVGLNTQGTHTFTHTDLKFWEGLLQDFCVPYCLSLLAL